MRVLDTVSHRLKRYYNPPRNLASLADTEAFPPGPNKLGSGAISAADGLPTAEEVVLLPAGMEVDADVTKGASCVPSATVLCLRDNRFRVVIDWRNQQDRTGVGMAQPLTADTGYFWFFAETNVEVILKILDGRTINGHFWVFYGALSNVEYTIRVTDTVTGHTKTFFNPLRNLASVADIEALPGE
jgi:hypothetical protein